MKIINDKIPYEDLKILNKPFIEEYLNILPKVLDSGWYILGKNVEEFEQEFAKYNNSKFACGVANGLDALTIGLLAFDFEKGSEIIVPANTYIASIISILNAGLKPILVEPSIDDYLIDVSKIEEKISSKTKAILPVHLYGKVCNMIEIKNIATKYGLKIIEDCAQSHGASINGQFSGTFGDIGAFSFYPSKNLGCIGDGGCILTNDEKLYLKIKALRNYGSHKKYHNDYIGINSRLDEIQAVFLSIKLKSLNKINSRKKEIASIYLEKIKNKKIILPKQSKQEENVYHIFPILCETRDDLKEFLQANGVVTEIHYPIAPHFQKGYINLFNESFPISEKIHSQELSLPISYIHTNQEIEKIVELINKY
jgi:dTDP-4-amino-4,6-dideoxygalactose transaminase